MLGLLELASAVNDNFVSATSCGKQKACRKRRVRIISDSDNEETADDTRFDCPVEQPSATASARAKALPAIPRKKQNGVRRARSAEKFAFIRHHFSDFFRLKKPPNYSSIQASQDTLPELKTRTKEQIKTRVWHMIQTGR